MFLTSTITFSGLFDNGLKHWSTHSSKLNTFNSYLWYTHKTASLLYKGKHSRGIVRLYTSSSSRSNNHARSTAESMTVMCALC